VPYPDCDIKVQSISDSRWDKRGSDQDRAVYARSIEGTEDLDASRVHRKLFQAHVRFCGHRFAIHLCRDLSIYCHPTEVKREDEVKVVKVVMTGKDILDVKE